MEWHCHGVEQIQELSDQVADAVCKQRQRYMDRKAFDKGILGGIVFVPGPFKRHVGYDQQQWRGQLE